MNRYALFVTPLVLAMAMAHAEGPQPGQQPTALSAPSAAPTGQAPAQVPAGQWVRAEAPGSNFPAAPGPAGQPVSNSQQQIRQAFPSSNYGPANYAVQGQPVNPGEGGQPQDGVAAMPPLNPPSNYEEAAEVAAPFTPEEIRKMRGLVEGSRRAKAEHPVRTVPRISSISVDLSPGASLPILRTLPGEMSTLVLLDSTGAPWPLAAAPRVSNNDLFDVEWLDGTPSVVISALTGYDDGNVTIFLKGLATPVVVKLVSGEPDGKQQKDRVVDYRLDLRVPGRGPNANAPLMGPGKIALYDDTLQAFLDGIPPSSAKVVVAHGEVPARTQVWQLDGNLFVRTSEDIQTAFDQSLASGDGTRVYRLPATPFVTLSQMGKAVTLQLDIN